MSDHDSSANYETSRTGAGVPVPALPHSRPVATGSTPAVTASLRRLPARAARACGLALVAATLLLSARAVSQRAPGLVLLSDEAYADLLTRAAQPGRVDPGEQAIIVRFDDRTFQTLRLSFAELAGPLAELVKRIRSAQPRAIGFDMGLGFLERKEDGRRFLDAVAKADDVVFATQVPTVDEPVVPLPTGVKEEAAARPLRTGFANLAFPDLAEQERVNRGAVIRAVPLRRQRGGRTHSSFALALVARARKLEPETATLDADQLRFDGRTIPLEHGLLRLDDPGPKGFVTVSMENVLKGLIPGAVFRDRIVLVGSMYQPLGDHHMTAFGRAFGVHLQASAVHTLLAGARYRVPFAAGLLVLAACLATALAFHAGRRAGVAAAVLSPIAVHAVCLTARSFGYLLPGAFALPAGPLTALLTARFLPVPGAAAAALSDEDPVVAVARASLGERYANPRLLGRGGMGVVLQAHDRERGCDVAVKIISPLLVDQQAVLKRFLREIRALRELTHPGIVKILDVFETARCPHYSMEIIAGTDLRKLLCVQGSLQPARAERLFRQLFDVLAHVHDRGIVHRDLKPENMLITPDDELRLLDFGIAHLPEATAMTQDGQVLGTLRYMSPEQAQGVELSPASDVFSAALVYFEVLTGRLPYPEIGRVLSFTQVPVLLRDLRPDVDPALEKLLDACLATDPKKRPPTARSVLERWPTG